MEYSYNIMTLKIKLELHRLNSEFNYSRRVYEQTSIRNWILDTQQCHLGIPEEGKIKI